MLGIVPYGPWASTGLTAGDTVKSEIIVGVRHPFTGPIVDQTGTERVCVGPSIPDQGLARTGWYVMGVQS